MSSYIPPTNRRRMRGRAPYVVSALRRKYAELLGQGNAAGLEHVGATLLLFSPSENLAAIRPVRAYKAQRERWMATAFTILRRERTPMSAVELTYSIMDAHGLDHRDRRRFKSIECGLHGLLARLEGDGVVRLQGSPKRWAIAGLPVVMESR